MLKLQFNGEFIFHINVICLTTERLLQYLRVSRSGEIWIVQAWISPLWFVMLAVELNALPASFANNNSLLHMIPEK
ncbi:hypothetical protein NQ317_010721 [Molorchus minor]|uniref:Uncharacterized protein n=1 Tax=Molorchus minor TaxID=1323400 RepID=A0ABQ9K689_9CUCU|nr:hypothetical protein NQ317_010721 [Molorchus minor]